MHCIYAHEPTLREILKKMNAQTAEEPDIEMPVSFDREVRNMRKGDSVAKVRRLDQSLSIADASEVLPTVRKQLRNACAPAVARAKRWNNGSYVVEVIDTQTPSGIAVIAIITRKE